MIADRKRVAMVRSWFDLPARPPSDVQLRDSAGAPLAPATLLPAPGAVLLITGPSGSGKSTLLGTLQQANRDGARRRWIDLSRIRLPDREAINCLHSMELQEALARLAEVGLAEAAMLLRRPAQLSEGERFRLRTALALHRADRCDAPCLLGCDEFAASLDDITAAVVSMALRRRVRRHRNVSLIVATGREQLMEALSPDVVARCDFGEVTVTTSTTPPG